MHVESICSARRALCAAALLAFALPHGNFAQAAEAVTGVWLTEDGDSKVEITTSGSGAAATLTGALVWLKQPTPNGKPLLDASNSDPALRTRPLMGIAILSGFKPAAGGGWSGGSVYAPRSGKSYPAELTLGADGKLQIKVKAGLVSKTVYWTR